MKYFSGKEKQERDEFNEEHGERRFPRAEVTGKEGVD